ncbi:hypothetical protein FVE85_4204 [Porphyridium purpureum]|uniref:Uncharacterized protein n=1 Tax=Porphyridium purpureum TaxID=35688 RepID=A0A5J4YS54_PORPP|nr:hypothetical protein FVE85_4204 [Porphyridium purpureum]|eukprot:POR1322..scf229_5
MEQNILGVFASLPDYGVPPRYRDGETLGRHIRGCLLRFVRDNIVLPLQGRGISMQNISIDIRHTLRTLYWGGRKETYECRRKSDGGKRYDIVAVTPESGCPRPCIGELLLFLKISYTTCPVNVQAAEYPNARMTVEHNPTEWNVAVISPWNLCALDNCYCNIASPVLHHLVADDTLDNLLCIQSAC